MPRAAISVNVLLSRKYWCAPGCRSIMPRSTPSESSVGAK